MNILICVTAISSVASFVEWYKKGLRGEEDAATGRCKTRAGVIEVFLLPRFVLHHGPFLSAFSVSPGYGWSWFIRCLYSPFNTW